MNPKKNQKTGKKRQEGNHSLTETLQKSENRQVGKAGKILTVDFTGRPSFGRIEKLEGWFETTEPEIQIVPEYKPCRSCGLFLGHEEVINADMFDSMCIECFSDQTGQDTAFSKHYPLQKSCTKCGLYVESGKDLYSALPGICNHCYLRITKQDANHSCIHCNPNFHI
tara:strand:- start:83 stop:586 length:504 start_codon:yes stop_codon:yes gene_type:complete